MCKRILTLDIKIFGVNKANGMGMSYKCRECLRERIKKLKAEGIFKNCNPKRSKSNNKARFRFRIKILERDNFTCQYCGRKPPEVQLEIDHIHPKSKGGVDKEHNLRTSCRDCNIGKGDILLKKPEQVGLTKKRKTR